MKLPENNSLKYREKLVDAKRTSDLDPNQKIYCHTSELGISIKKRQTELSIYGGGIAILSKAEGKPILLYSPDIQKHFKIKDDAHKYEYLHTPYILFESNSSFSCFIDLLFFVSRDTQRPEYVLGIANIATQHRFEYPFQWELRKKYEILHCSTGEILFFCLLWRIIIELINRNNNLNSIYSINLFDSSEKTDWKTLFNNDNHDFIERMIIEKLEIAQETKDNPLSASVLTAGRRFFDNLKTTNLLFESIFEDIGLCNDNAIKELNKYSDYIFKGNLTHFNKFNHKEYIFGALQLFAAKTNLESGKFSIGQLLNTLHTYSRFPILPYYFLMFFDDEKHLKEHIVFPIWYTGTEDTKYIYINEKGIRGKESAVLHALYTVKPIWEIDNYKNGNNWYSINDKTDAPSINDSFEHYLNELLSFFTSMSKPIIDKEYYATEAKKNLQDIKLQAIRAAISQVMARNTSHNIGSHVLNKLIGDLSKIKFSTFKLYQSSATLTSKKNETTILLDQLSVFNNYLKCRLDYLSDVTFGTPLMQTTKKVNELFEDLDKVRLLLENISGLIDFHYKIEFKIPEDKVDLSIGIPNDILGCQAFYNIIENVIRNTAKHANKGHVGNESNPAVFTIEFKEANKQETDNNLLKEELETYYEVNIYDNVPILEKPHILDTTQKDEKGKTEKEYFFSDTGNNDTAISEIDWLVYRQNKKINESILKENNTLRASSLGLIEMEASACYLRKIDITLLENDDYSIEFTKANSYNAYGKANIFKAVKISNPEKKENYLGYRFYVLKPTEILFVSDNKTLKNKITEIHRSEGILLKRKEDFENDLQNGKVFTHQFVIYDEDTVETVINKFEEKYIDGKKYQVKKYATSLPLRYFKKENIEEWVKGKQTKVILENVWQSWMRKNIKYCIENSYDESIVENVLVLLNHDTVFDENINYKCYVEALSSIAQSKLPNYPSIGKGSKETSITVYMNNINGHEKEKNQIIESALQRIIVIDERVQNTAFESNKSEKKYTATNVIIPSKTEIILSEKDLNKDKLLEYIDGNLKPECFLLIHYSLLERIFRNDNDKSVVINQYLDKISSVSNIFVTSGRGMIQGLTSSVRFVNLSPVLAALIEIRSKFLINYILNCARKNTGI